MSTLAAVLSSSSSSRSHSRSKMMILFETLLTHYSENEFHLDPDLIEMESNEEKIYLNNNNNNEIFFTFDCHERLNRIRNNHHHHPTTTG